MRKDVSCLAFTWSRSDDHITDQSYYLQITVSLFYLLYGWTQLATHDTLLLNKRSAHKKDLLTKTYISSYISLLTRSYHFCIILRGASAIVLTWMSLAMILQFSDKILERCIYYSTSGNYESVGALICCCNCIITVLTIRN